MRNSKMQSIMLTALAAVCIVICLGLGSTVSAVTTLYPLEMPDPSDSMAVGVRGSFYAGQAAALKRINEIRKEACKKGYPNPNNGKKLTMADYVPLKWSAYLEDYARLRAVEASVYAKHWIIGSYLEPKNPSEGYQLHGQECLAWSSGGPLSMLGAVNLWYREKKNYVGNGSGQTGHYMTMIDPEKLYVGIGAFEARGNLGCAWHGAVSGQFEGELIDFWNQGGDLTGGTSMQPAMKDVIQVISVYKSMLGAPHLAIIKGEGEKLKKGVYGTTHTLHSELAVVRDTKFKEGAGLSDGSGMVLDLNQYTFQSSKPGRYLVRKSGKAVALKPGTVTVTAKRADGVKYTMKVKIEEDFFKPSFLKLKRKGKKLVVKFEADDLTNGTQIQVSANKSFTKILKDVKVKTKVDKYQYKKTIKKLKKKGKLYVRARAYLKKGGRVYYTYWTKVKRVK